MFWRGPFARHKEDVDEELAAHIELSVRDRVERGQSPAAAREAALRELGNIALIRDVDAEMGRHRGLTISSAISVTTCVNSPIRPAIPSPPS